MYLSQFGACILNCYYVPLITDECNRGMVGGDSYFSFSSVVSDSFMTPWIAACQASLSITNSQSLFKLMSIELVTPSSPLILYCSVLLLPPIPSIIRVFSNKSTLCMRWPKYWSLSFSISPSNEHPGLISYRMDWLDLLAVQGTLESSPTVPLAKHWRFMMEVC